MVVGRGVEHGELSVDGAGNKCSKRSDADGAIDMDFKLDLLIFGGRLFTSYFDICERRGLSSHKSSRISSVGRAHDS